MKAIWTSMVQVAGDRSNLILRGHTGAYVWVAAQADNLEDYRGCIVGSLRKLDLSLVSLEEVRTAEEAETKDVQSAELLELIARVRHREEESAYGIFYGFQQM